MLAKRTMVDPINDIVRQARQGSVSAIIQVLNDKLADSGVRTRAIFEQGVLQLLCEAPRPDQLEQGVLVPRVKTILESLQPRHVRRVNINSRIVREQQLLWLDEIHREPENLLWTEEILLKQPGFWQRWTQDWKDSKPAPAKTNLPKTSAREAEEKRVFWRGLMGGAGLSVLLVLVGWAVYNWLNPKLAGAPAGTASSAATSPSIAASPAAPAPKPAASPASPAAGSAQAADPFAEAVRTAEEAARVGRQAQTSAEWLDLAARWQRASDLMSQVAPGDQRYATAQDRVKRYRENSTSALQQAQKGNQGTSP